MGLLTAALLTASAFQAGGQIASGLAARKTANQATAEGARLAADARARGLETERNYTFNLAALMGKQRAAGGAAGIDVTQGSAAQIAADTERIGAIDLATIRANVAREARGIRANYELQAKGLRAQATGQFVNAGATLLQGATDAWQSYKSNWRARGERILSTSFVQNPSFY